jgi:hypothetical protein
MKKLLAGLAVGMVLGMTGVASAELVVDGTVNYEGSDRKLIYNDNLNITWLDYSYLGDWHKTNEWANGISVSFGGNAYDNFRLPEINELVNIVNGTGEGVWSPFNNLVLNSVYWSNTQGYGSIEIMLSNPCGPTQSWTGTPYNNFHGIAVFDGRIPQATPVPVPASMLLLGTGLAGLIGARRKKKA